jgi:hypothetical protein
MKYHHLSIFLLAVLAAASGHAATADPVTIVLENGVNGYDGTFDRRIGPGGELDGLSITGQTTYYLDGGSSTLNDSGYTQGLIRFSGVETIIPAGAKILDAKLTVVTKTHSNAQSGDSFSVYRLTRAFDSDSSVTSDFGADGLAGDVDWILGSFHGPNIASEASVVSADVTRAVQSWVDGSPNHGLGIRSDRGTNGWSFHTTGAAAGLRPKLEIKYLLDEGVAANDFQQGLNGYVEGTQVIFSAPTPVAPDAPVYTTIVGSTVQEAFLDGINPPTLEPDISSMLRFGGVEAQLAGRKIETATLKVVTGFSSSNATSPGPFTVHRLLVPFTETSVYADFAGDAGAMLSAGQITPAIATFTGMANCEAVDVDVSEAVKAWASGAPNHGLYIGSGSPNGWQIFTTGANDISFRPLLRVVSSPALPIEVVSPAASSRHPQGSTVTLQAETAVVAPVTVSQVEFFLNGTSAGIDASAPYTWSYPAETLGNFVLTARMTDSTSAVTNSEPVAFSVVPVAGIGGLYFDGITDHVALGDAAELKLPVFTLETWFRRETSGVATTTGTGGVVAVPLIAKGRNQADNSTLDTNWFLGIRESDGVLCADFEGATGINVPVAGVTPVSYGVWQHAAATFDGTEWRLYLNGNLEAVRDANGATPRADSIQHASIATAMNSNGLGEGAFGGFMDEVRIWNAARSHAEIRQTINSEVNFAAGLIARWAMTEGAGNTVTSSASAATVGSFGGAPVWAAGMTFTNNAKPSVAFLTPQDGGDFLNTSPLDITVLANDPDGSVAQVEYFDNGVSIGISTSAPFSLTYANPPVGTRRLMAVVTDNGGEASRADLVLTVYTTFESPTVPGYSAGIIDGADAELFTGTPAVDPAVWSVVSTSAAPRAFEAPGTVPGDIAVNVNGAPVASAAGIILAANVALNGNFASFDNVVAPYDLAGFYHVSSMDNSGPGEIEPTLSPESSSFSLGWFPYADGWIGATISADGTIPGGSSSLPATASVTPTATGTYQISGLPVSGNLIAVAYGNATDNYTAIGQSGDNWIVTVRDNNQNLENGGFSILYIPGTANRVLSGKIGNLGEFTALNDELALLGVSTRLTAQGYQLTFGDGSVINPSNTVLFISPDSNAGNGADNVYGYSASGNSFVVFSHDLPGLNGAMQNGGFRFLATPLNTVAPVADEVVLSVTDAEAAEDGTDQVLAFTVTRRGNTASDLIVNYTVGGTATPGADYSALTGWVSIPAGSSSAAIAVSVLADSLLEQSETVTVTLAAGPGYSVGLYATAMGTIADGFSTLPTNTVVFQQGLNGYTGQFQKRVGYALSSGTYTAQLGSAVANYALDGGDPDINDLIRFDNIISGPGGIPAGARVLKAELFLTTAVANDAQTGGPFIVDRLTSAVDAGTTYDSISNGIGFEGIRGISTGLPVAGFPALAQGQAGAADVTDIVRAWASGEPNHGFGVFSGGTTDGWNYCTVGNANVSLRPKLVVTYINQATREYTYTADQSARINSAPGSTTIDGSTLDAELIDSATNNTQEALLRFPVAFSDETPGAIPLDEEIVKAELLVTTPSSSFSAGAHSPGPISVHRMLADWNPATSYGINGPQIGTHISESVAAMTGLGQGSTTWIDITSIVRAWRSGAANYGLNLKPGTADDWMLFWPGTPYGESAQPRLRITTAGGSIPDNVPFDVWAASFNAQGISLDSDSDNDGITALVEYALGFSPTTVEVLPGITRNGDTISLSFQKGLQAADDPRMSYAIRSSTDLRNWTLETPTVNNGTVITLDQAIGVANKFFRLEIVYTP